jgi:hypothetical protein
MIAFKYAEFGAGRVTEDLHENHGRRVTRSFVQDVADAVAAVALAKEETWEYALPALGEPVATITMGLDGTCMLRGEDGWREAMVGTLGFSDKEGQRLHTVDTAATPEYGKLTFLDRLEREIERVQAAYPEALYVGLADGAKENWIYLELKTQEQVVDFYHVTQYLGSAAEVLFAASASELGPWIDDWCHRLKHEIGAAAALLADLELGGKALGRKRLPGEIEAALTYLRNQVKGGRMNSAELVERQIPIGSGVTEAACKPAERNNFYNSASSPMMLGCPPIRNSHRSSLRSSRCSMRGSDGSSSPLRHAPWATVASRGSAGLRASRAPRSRRR